MESHSSCLIEKGYIDTEGISYFDFHEFVITEMSYGIRCGLSGLMVSSWFEPWNTTIKDRTITPEHIKHCLAFWEVMRSRYGKDWKLF